MRKDVPMLDPLASGMCAHCTALSITSTAGTLHRSFIGGEKRGAWFEDQLSGKFKPMPHRASHTSITISWQNSFNQRSSLTINRRIQIKPHWVPDFELGKHEPDMLIVNSYARLVGVPMELIVDDAITVNAFRKLLDKENRRTSQTHDEH